MLKTYHVFSEIAELEAMDLDSTHTIEKALDAQDAVNLACNKFWSENDGWEWMMKGCTFYSLCVESGEKRKHEVGTPDFEPFFYASNGEVIQ